jgi:pimeloyl-ACP methyl ester carboxylesterase
MELAHDRRGAGAPLVLIHGIGSRRGVWMPVVERLVAERETIALDLPGFGDSPPLAPGVRPTVEALSDAVAAFCERQGLGRPHVAGNSLGGGIALELARRGLVASAAALSPIGFWTPGERRLGTAQLRLSRLAAERMPGLVDRLARSPTGRRLAFGHLLGRPARRDPHEAALDARALAAAPGFWPTLPEIQRHVFQGGEEIEVPVTIGWGTRDRILIPRQAERARAALPRARHLPLPGCGHVPMSDDPEGVAALLRAASS